MAFTGRVVDRPLYTKYRKAKLDKKVKIKGRQEMADLFNCFFETIAEQLIELEGGVNIEGLGYFFIWRIPKKMSYYIPSAEAHDIDLFNHHTDNYIYAPQFIPTKKNRVWSMDRNFSFPLKQELCKALKEGRKYKMNLVSLRKMKLL